MQVKKFTFNPFQENTFILFDDTKECLIVDAGCYFPEEFVQLKKFIEENDLVPQKLISTHSHLDHVFGNHIVTKELKLQLGIHPEDEQTLKMLKTTADLYQVPNVFESPEPDFYFEHGDTIKFGKSELEVRFVPGHAPGHVVFVDHKDSLVINGDCLFAGSIGRTDLPGGDHATLLKSIQEQLFTLPDEYVVYCGHGPETTVGDEKRTNPFF
ncbi:MBL fold metallo-hydrolase [Parvicella tangerina]|uniref:Hydroxyacylglutathione hydrolase GloC n=1 Tax=Parvicella tangerina TaxID=2829795 RepID=A0A916JKL9_9FLAO|nr:MBL fold metallo-hydrolase [Parvicella tangerina]CAG5079589.1 Hydroxyacylglutathione hydrolase GloC [Parvicella tangerina]